MTIIEMKNISIAAANDDGERIGPWLQLDMPSAAFAHAATEAAATKYTAFVHSVQRSAACSMTGHITAGNMIRLEAVLGLHVSRHTWRRRRVASMLRQVAETP